MPTFLPKIPVTFAIFLLFSAQLGSVAIGWGVLGLTSSALWFVPNGTRFFFPLTEGLRPGLNYSVPSGLRSRSVIGVSQRPTTNDQRLFMFLAKRLDLDVHACRQVELHQRVDSLLCGFENIQQTLVRTNFELLTRLLVDVRRTQHTVLVFHRGQWNRPRDLRARALRGLDDFTRGLIQDAIVVSLQPNTNSFFSNHFELSLTPPGFPGRKNWRQVEAFMRRLSRVPKSRAKRGISTSALLCSTLTAQSR